MSVPWTVGVGLVKVAPLASRQLRQARCRTADVPSAAPLTSPKFATPVFNSPESVPANSYTNL